MLLMTEPTVNDQAAGEPAPPLTHPIITAVGWTWCRRGTRRRPKRRIYNEASIDLCL